MIQRLAGKLSRKMSPATHVPPAERENTRTDISDKPAHGSHSSHPLHENRMIHGENWSVADFNVPARDGSVRFHDLNIPEPIMHAICDLGFKYCTPIQGKVLAHATQGQNIAGRAQTGTGKTAAFLIRILSHFIATRERDGRAYGTPRALVIAPTRELVVQIEKDAKDLARYCNVSTMAVYGGIDFDKQLHRLENHRIDLIAATPGRLIDFVNRGVISLNRVEALVIDEADRMLDMGFIPDVRRIIRATPPKERRQTMLFSATLTEDVLRLASQWMPDPVICEVDPEHATVDTIKQITYVVTAEDKFNLLYNLIRGENMQRVLLFGNRRDSTERLAEALQRHGMPCEYLSGAVRQEKRMRILDGFRSGKIRIVVATDVAGRGLHVDNITHVINYDFPYEPEDYIHRIGRTGRAGVQGTAISFACEYESFVIPQIEAYLGQKLTCIVPDMKLLVPPPSTGVPVKPVRSMEHDRRTPGHSRGAQGRSSRRPRNRSGHGGSNTGYRGNAR